MTEITTQTTGALVSFTGKILGMSGEGLLIDFGKSHQPMRLPMSSVNTSSNEDGTTEITMETNLAFQKGLIV